MEHVEHSQEEVTPLGHTPTRFPDCVVGDVAVSFDLFSGLCLCTEDTGAGRFNGARMVSDMVGGCVVEKWVAYGALDVC